MGKEYKLIQHHSNRYVSAHALGGGYKLTEFWDENHVGEMVTWLATIYGNRWSLVAEYPTSTLENVGYTKQVRVAAVKHGWTTWTAIRDHDHVTNISLSATDLHGNPTRDESDIPNGFKTRYVHFFTFDELLTYENQVETYMGLLWKTEWKGKTLKELVDLGNAAL